MKKTILFVTQKHSSFTVPITDALIQLGFKVYTYDYQKPDLLARMLGLTANLASSAILSKAFDKWVNLKLAGISTLLKPEYILVIKGETLEPQTIEFIKKKGISTINWFPDNVGSWELIMKTARNYDFYFSVCKYLTKKLNTMGRKTFYLPVADVALRKLTKEHKQYNLVFAGHKTEKRVRFFSQVLDLGFHLWGYPHWITTALAPFYHGPLKVDQMKKVFRKSKIVVNVSTAEEGVPISIANLKNFEASGVGAFVLSEYNPALAELFKEGKEMVFFRTKEEFRRKSIYYLKQDKRREKIAFMGWKRTKKEHTYKRRLEKLFQLIKKENKA